MSDEKPAEKPPYAPKPASSGEHPAVKGFRAKLESIRDNQLPEIEAINARLLKLKTPIPPPIPREDGDDEIPVDVVEIEKP